MRAIRPSKKGWAFRNQTTRLIWSRRPTTVVSESLPVLAPHPRKSNRRRAMPRGMSASANCRYFPLSFDDAKPWDATTHGAPYRPSSAGSGMWNTAEIRSFPERNPDGEFQRLDRSQRDEILLMETATVENASL